MKTSTKPWLRRQSTHAAGVVLPAICALTAFVGVGLGLLVVQGAQRSPGTGLLQVTTTGAAAVVREVAPAAPALPVAADVEAPAPTITVIEERPVDATPSDIRYFDGRPIRPVKTISMIVTAYSPDARSCAPFADGITASGKSVVTNGGKLIAADKRFKFGSLLSVPGYNNNLPTPVLDRGGAIKGNRLDVLYPTHEIARKWGRQRLDVVVWEYVDG
ncbi:MAG: 3D domain-containing protein [Phycisphaerales bacterium]|nr:3D domain-containing protein [Phycisphaerales bacterium]